MAQKSIVVADDDASIRSLLRQLLSDEGYSVQEAATGVEVVDKVREGSPDLVIMDVRMPELDGIEALSRVKAASPGTSVLIMTAFGSSNAAIRAPTISPSRSATLAGHPLPGTRSGSPWSSCAATGAPSGSSARASKPSQLAPTRGSRPAYRRDHGIHPPSGAADRGLRARPPDPP